jgi:hypothetical protein
MNYYKGTRGNTNNETIGTGTPSSSTPISRMSGAREMTRALYADPKFLVII